MRRFKVVAILGVLLLCTSCAGGEASKEALIKAINATVPFKDLAFFRFDGTVLAVITKVLGYLRYVAALACFCYIISLLRWHQREGDFQELLDPISGPLRWLLIVGLLTAAFTIFQMCHEAAVALWPEGLEFGFWRESLGFTILILEEMPKGDANIATFFGALASLPAVLGIHKGWEWVLFSLWVGCLLWSAFSGSLKPLVIWLIFCACWVAWGPLWYVELFLIGSFIGESNIIVNSFRFMNTIYLITTWGSMTVLFVGIPVIAAVSLPWPEAQARPAAKGVNLQELFQSVGAFNALFPNLGQGGRNPRGGGGLVTDAGNGYGDVIYPEPPDRFAKLPPGGASGNHADDSQPPSDPNQNPPFGGLLPAAGETGRGSNLNQSGDPSAPGGNRGRRGSGRLGSNHSGGLASSGNRNPSADPRGSAERGPNLDPSVSNAQGGSEESSEGDPLPEVALGGGSLDQSYYKPSEGSENVSEPPAGQDKAFYAKHDYIVDGRVVCRQGERIYPDSAGQEGLVYNGDIIPSDLLEEGGEA